MNRLWYVFLCLSLIVIAPITRPVHATLVNFSLTGHCTLATSGGGLTLTADGAPSSLTTVTGTFDADIDPAISAQQVNFGYLSGNSFTWSIGGFYLYPSDDVDFSDGITYPRMWFGNGVPYAFSFLNDDEVLNGLNVDSYAGWAIWPTSGSNIYEGVWDFDTYSTVPVPPAILLLGSAIVGLAGFRKKVYKR